MEEDEGVPAPNKSEVFGTRVTNGADGVIKALKLMNSLAIEEIQRTVQGSEPIELARAYVYLKTAMSGIEEAFEKGLGRTFNVLKTKDWPKMLQDRGIKNVPLTDLGYTVGKTNYVTVVQHNEELCVDYLLNHEENDENGAPHKPYAGAMKHSIHWKTLGAIASGLAKQGKALPQTLRDEKGKRVFGPDGNPIQMFETTTNEIATMRKITEKKD